jgi:predicted nucleic acid-binding protein
MSAADIFFDTSTLLYLVSAETRKADRVEELLASHGTISVQVLNEFMAVARRKLGMRIDEVREILGVVRKLCTVEDVSAETHDRATLIHQRYGFGFFDSVLVASALMSGARLLYSEDLQHGQVIDKRLRVVNPFR